MPSELRARCLQGGGEILLGLLLSIAALIFCNQVVWMHPQSLLWANEIDIYGGQDLAGTLFLIARSLTDEVGASTSLIAWPSSHSFGPHFQNPFFTDILGWMVGVFGQPLGYNLGILLALATNGLAVQLAVRLAGGGPLAGILCAVLAATSPFCINEVLEGRAVSAWWAPAIGASALCLSALRSWRHMLLALPGLYLLWIALLVYPYGPALLAPWTLLAAVFCLARIEGWKARLLRGALIALSAIGLLLIYIRLSGISAGEALQYHIPNDALTTHGRVVPSHLFYLGIAGAPEFWSSLFFRLGLGNMGFQDDSLLRVPALLWLVAIPCMIATWKGFRTWLPGILASVLLLLVSMGPEPGGEGRWTAYDALLDWIPVFRACPRPDRYGMPGYLLLVMALGIALSAAHARLPGDSTQPRRRAMGAGLAALFGYGVLMQVWTAQPNLLQTWPAWKGLDALDEETVLLDLPLVLPDKTSMLLYATVPVPRANPHANSFQFWRDHLDPGSTPLLMAAADVHERGELSPPIAAALASRGPAEIQKGLRCVLLHPSEETGESETPWIELMESAGATRIAENEHGIQLFALDDPEDCTWEGGDLESTTP